MFTILIASYEQRTPASWRGVKSLPAICMHAPPPERCRGVLNPDRRGGFGLRNLVASVTGAAFADLTLSRAGLRTCKDDEATVQNESMDKKQVERAQQKLDRDYAGGQRSGMHARSWNRSLTVRTLVSRQRNPGRLDIRSLQSRKASTRRRLSAGAVLLKYTVGLSLHCEGRRREESTEAPRRLWQKALAALSAISSLCEEITYSCGNVSCLFATVASLSLTYSRKGFVRLRLVKTDASGQPQPDLDIR